MKKELRPTHDQVSCDICGRTILKGERVEAYLAGAGERMLVCELCAPRADREGWIRESAHADMPVSRGPRANQRRGLFGRLRRRGDEAPLEPLGAPLQHDDLAAGQPEAHLEQELGELPPEADAPELEWEDAEPATRPPAEPAQAPSQPRDPRHVRAVPTNARLKVERALELFNGSEHPRTIAGIARTLGPPWVSANPLADSPSAVAVVVAWELSWYRYRVDLADADEPVSLVGTGQELEELDDELREWNGAATEDGALAVGVGSEQ
jgi:hypothetical protein